MKIANKQLEIQMVAVRFVKVEQADFKLVEFDQFKNEAGFNYFILSPKKWIEST